MLGESMLQVVWVAVKEHRLSYHYLPYIRIMATEIEFPNINPGSVPRHCSCLQVKPSPGHACFIEGLGSI